MKAIIILVGCLLAAAIGWALFQLLGHYTFLVFLSVMLWLFYSKSHKHKFGKASSHQEKP